MTLLLGMLGALAGVEKKFQIAFGAGEVAGLNAEQVEICGVGGGLHAFDGFLVQGFVFDDSAFADFAALQFELGFDEDQEIGVRCGYRRDCGKNFRDGDEGDVHGY